MSGYRDGYIKLDSPRNVFYPGQMVLGSVVFEIEQSFSLNALFVDYIGEAKVYWKEQESEEYNGVKRYKEVEYVGREEYFNVRQLLAGGNAPINLHPGTHTYQFSYQIPPGVPSSFSGERGDIKYRLVATIDLQGREGMKDELTKYFEVVSPLDLNKEPDMKKPVDIEFEETVGCSCFSSSPITVRVRLPVTGYCPGQVIPVALEVDNTSNVEVRKLVFQILTREAYRTQSPISEYMPPERVLATVKKGAIMSSSKKNLTVDVKLPDLIAPNLDNCEIIDVGYFFKVIIKLSGCSDDMEDEAEILLGLVPLNETLDGEYVHPYSESLPIGPIPDIPVTNQQEQNRQVAGQQSAYPGQQSAYPGQQSVYPNQQSAFPGQNTGYPGPPAYPQPPITFPTPPGYPSNTNVQGSYHVQVQQMRYSSTDPSKNFNIGFTMSSQSQPGAQPYPGQNWPQFPGNSDLRIHLPQPNVDVKTPSAPPPSS